MLRRIRQSVRAKLLVLMLATTSVALIVAVAALVVYDVRTYEERWVSDLTTQADILGRSSVPALAFDDPKAARENLDLLKVRPAILAAAIYDNEGRIFATYGRIGAGEQTVPRSPVAAGPRIEGKHIVLFHRIVENDRPQGTVYIKARYEIAERLADYLGILAAVVVLSMLAALFMSAWLQRAITRPINEITSVAHHVMDSRDFSLRVRKTTEDEIGYLVDAFNNMLAEIGRRSEALLKADRMKDEFLATLAHELRNPLAPISNALHLLEAAGNRPEVARNARAMMARQLKQLVRLVDDLLDVSRITTGKLILHRQRTELGSVIDNAVEIAKPVIESRGHRLNILLPGSPVHLDGDETRLAQVFSNLLNNAARYTDAGGVIELRAEASSSHVHVVVVDNGMGIAPEVMPEIFKMFTQANTSIERAQAGLGVGLALSKHLVEMHGGSIEAQSEGVGHGSRFTVHLPLAQAAAAEERAASAVTDAPSGSSRILVVDDNQDFATSLAMILRDLGHEVRVEHDGVEGLRAAEAFQPAVAFLDIGLPGLNGYEVARRMRGHQRNSYVVLVAVTGWGQDSDKERSRQAGFDYHLVKPLDPTRLPSILEAVAAKHRAAPPTGA
jgi:signal transduction histidine kinase/ActR/RegA family two-component response regulator